MRFIIGHASFLENVEYNVIDHIKRMQLQKIFDREKTFKVRIANIFIAFEKSNATEQISFFPYCEMTEQPVYKIDG